MNQIITENNKIIIDPSQFNPITPTRKHILTMTVNDLTKKALKLMELFNVSIDDILLPHPFLKTQLVISAYDEAITAKDIQSELKKFKNISKEIDNLKSKGYELSTSAAKAIDIEKQLNADLNELLNITRMEAEMITYNHGMNYNNSPAFLFFKEKKDYICGNLRIIETPDGFKPSNSCRRHVKNKIEIEDLSLNQKKYLIIQAAFLEKTDQKATNKD